MSEKVAGRRKARVLTLKVGRVTFGGRRLSVIAGPCVIESERLCVDTARRLKRMCSDASVGLLFKSSFDKANRSSLDSFRGPGIDQGLEILARVRRDVGVPVVTDIHLPEQAEQAARIVDALQVPSFLCRQTDLLVAAGHTGKPVFVKKGQFMSPREMENAVQKVRSASSGSHSVAVTERGTTFGYNNVVVDMRGIAVMREFAPVVFDATHSVQEPGALGGASGGNRDFVPVMARAAVAAGADGIFLETHPDPDRALCDGPNMLELSRLPSLLKLLAKLYRVVAPAVGHK